MSAAARHNQAHAVTVLLELGARADLADAQEDTPLSIAIRHSHTDIARLLRQAGADPGTAHVHGDHGAPASAADAYHPVRPQTLLEAGARPDLGTQAGQDLLLQVFARDDTETVARWFPRDSVLDNGGDRGEVWNPMGFAVEAGTAQVIGILRDAGYGVEVSDEHGRSILMLASHRDRADLVNALLETRNGRAGADPNAQARSDGMNALMYATSVGGLHSIQLLLAAGVDPNATDHAGRVALDYAVFCPDPQRRSIVDALLEEAMLAPAWSQWQEWAKWKQEMDDIDGCLPPPLNDGDTRQEAAVNASGTSLPAAVMDDIGDSCAPDAAMVADTPSLLPYHLS